MTRPKGRLHAALHRVDERINRADDYLWSWGLRRWRRPELRVTKPTAVANEPDRHSEPFDFERMAGSYLHSVTIEDRLYNYVLYPGDSSVLVLHFSGFFDAAGARRRFRDQDINGFFHRLRMFWPLTDYNFLFLVDTFGPDKNGCYYKGLDGDFFVDRAMRQVIQTAADQRNVDASRIVASGSSMGGTVAVRLALAMNMGGAVAVCPHLDLDTSALLQNRVPHVAAILGDQDVANEKYLPITREIRNLIQSSSPLPRLVVQSMKDDHGVHYEQVLPIVELWRANGGEIVLEDHESGGHTSDYATPEFFARSIDWCLRP